MSDDAMSTETQTSRRAWRRLRRAGAPRPTKGNVLATILALGVVAGWVLGPTVPANGFLLMFASLVMGTAFFGRRFSLPGIVVVAVALRGDPIDAAALAGVLLVVGERVTHLRRRVGRFVQRSFTDR